MRKIIAILCTTICLVFTQQTAQSQENIVKLYPVGVDVNSANVKTANFLLKFAAFEHVFTDKISGQINLGVVFTKVGFGFFSSTTARFVIEPQVKVYLMDDAPHGLYTGGYYYVAVRGGGAEMGVGPHVGYQHLFLNDRLAVDATLGIGFGMLVGSGTSSFGFHMPFQVGAGYAF